MTLGFSRLKIRINKKSRRCGRSTPAVFYKTERREDDKVNIYVVNDYPKKNDESLVCADCISEVLAEGEFYNHELRDLGAIDYGEKCAGICNREIETLIY